MKPQKQLFGHDPDDDVWGDCYRTAVAVILGMDVEDVPHFCEGGSLDAPERCRDWLSQFGLTHFTTFWNGDETLDAVLQTTAIYNPDVPFILSGEGGRGVNHSVVVMNGEIVCDPYTGKPNPEALVGPAKAPQGPLYWWAEIISVGAKR